MKGVCWSIKIVSKFCCFGVTWGSLYRCKESHLVTETKRGSRILLNHTCSDECIIKLIFYVVYVIWNIRSIWKFFGSGAEVFNIIYHKEIWSEMVQVFLFYVHEPFINKCEILGKYI